MTIQLYYIYLSLRVKSVWLVYSYNKQVLHVLNKADIICLKKFQSSKLFYQ